MLKVRNTIIYLFIVIFLQLISGQGKANTKTGLIISSEYFSKPIPCVSSWYDPIKRATTFGRPLEPDTIINFSSKTSSDTLVLNINKKTNRGPCFGTFRETERLYDGYVVHFKADPVDKECANYVSHAFLIPFASRPDTKFLLRLYHGPIYKGELPIDLEKIGTKTKISTLEKENLKQIYNKINNEMASLHRAKKMADFLNHPEFEKAKPLYDTCMLYKQFGDNHEYYSKESFCMCIAQKFSYGNQIPNEELNVYVKNFETLLNTKSTKSDTFYPHSINSCEGCRHKRRNRDLRDHCVGPGIEVGKYITKSAGAVQVASGESYRVILKAFLDNNYSSIKKDMLFKNFFIDYIQAYSDLCGQKHIRNGVHRKTTKWNEELLTGFKVGLEETHEIYIDSRYVKLFDQYSSDVSRYYLVKFLSGDAIANMKKTMDSMIKIVQATVAARLVLNNHLGNKCANQDVRMVYERLLKYHH